MSARQTIPAAPDYHQIGADRFERRDPMPQVPFALDDAQIYPALPEALFWVACFGLLLMLFSMAMGADIFKILRLVA